MARRSSTPTQAPRRSSLISLVALPLAGVLVCRLAPAFLPGPQSKSEEALRHRSTHAAAAAAVVAFGSLLPAHAELPPLEDLPLEGLSGQMSPDAWVQVSKDETWELPYGLGQAPVLILFGLLPLFLAPIAFAANWALFWINTIKPDKVVKGDYEIYFGFGQKPPDGYYNSLDPRSTGYDSDDDEDDYTQGGQTIVEQAKEKSKASAMV